MTKKPKKTKKEDLPYRPCVGIILLNPSGLVFAGRRIDTPENAWQMPQGGIDKGEKPKKAAKRELLEEVGTNNVDILASTDDWLCYDLPDHLIGKVWKGKYRGQKQKWFVMRFLGVDSDIDLNASGHPEFSEWCWQPFDQLPDLVVPFKRDIYQKLVDAFGDLAGRPAIL